MRLRDTRIAVALRGAHEAGRRVVIGFEMVAIIGVAATAAWASTSPGTGPLAITHLVAIAAASALTLLATVVIPNDAPPAPSWWVKQRRGIARSHNC